MHPFFTLWKHLKTVEFSDVCMVQRKGALGQGKNGLGSVKDATNLSQLIYIY